MKEHYKDDNIKHIYEEIGCYIKESFYINHKDHIRRSVYYKDKIVIMSKSDSDLIHFKETIEKIISEFIHEYDIGYTIYKDDQVESNYISVLKNDPDNIKKLIQMHGIRYNISDETIEFCINLSKKINPDIIEKENELISYVIIKMISDQNNEIIFGDPNYSKKDINKTEKLINNQL